MDWYHDWWAYSYIWRPVLLELLQEKEPFREVEILALTNILEDAIFAYKFRRFYGSDLG